MTKKYILKPGKHQFAPGSPAVHDNDTLSDKEAKWYLEKYPHIAALFDCFPLKSRNNESEENNSGLENPSTTTGDINENLLTAN